MTARYGSLLIACLMAAEMAWGAQIVAFNDPTAWLTQRSEKIIVKVHLDTALIKSKKIKMAMSVVKNGGRKCLR